MFESYYKKIIQFDLINKFLYSSIKKFPQLKKIILNFGCNNSDTKSLVSVFFFLNLITKKKGLLIKSKKTNVLLKIKKGNVVGCKIILKKNSTMHNFFKIILQTFFSNFKLSKNDCFKKQKKIGFSFTLKNFVNFKAFKYQFYLFNLPKLNITIIFINTSKKELFYLLQSLKIKAIITQW